MKTIVINPATKEYLLRLVTVACMTYPAIVFAGMLEALRPVWSSVFRAAWIWLYFVLYAWAAILLSSSVIRAVFNSSLTKELVFGLKTSHRRFDAWMKKPSEIRFKE